MPAVARLAAVLMVAFLPVYLPVARADDDSVNTPSRIPRVPSVQETLAPVILAAPKRPGPDPVDDWGYDPLQPTVCGECGYEVSSGRNMALHEAFGHLTVDDIDTWG